VAELRRLGLPRVLLEGGPSLLAATAASDRLDELCLTISPVVTGGEAPRIAHGPPADLRLRLAHLAECGGALLGRWLVVR
jgi:5-amino-6-(5-phosphoribosylamino)uracil reductase